MPISKEKPKIGAVRIRVQEMDGRKAIKTKGITVYNASVGEVYKIVEDAIDEASATAKK